MPLKIPVERIVQRGLARYAIRREYEKGFRAFTPETLKRLGFDSALTPGGEQLLSGRPKARELPELSREDKRAVSKYLSALHKRADATARKNANVAGKPMPPSSSVLTPFGKVEFSRNTYWGPHAVPQEGRAYATIHFGVGRREEHFKIKLQHTREVAAHETEHLHSDLSWRAKGGEQTLLHELIAVAGAGLYEGIIPIAATMWWQDNYNDRIDHLHDIFPILLRKVATLPFRSRERKKFATILADPAVKTLDDARQVIEHIEKNRHLLKN